MESIATLKTAATRAIWGENGEQHQEPISGQRGDVSKGEPYDAGNMEPKEAAKFTAPDETGTQPVETNLKNNSEETSKANKPKPDEKQHQQQDTDGGINKQKEEVNPATIDSSTTKKDSTKAQNDVRDPSEPTAHPDKAAARENVDDTSSGLDVGDNPEKLDGPGPRPIEEVAREHGGDAGKSGSDESLDSGKNLGGGGAGELGDGKNGKHSSGTGELYVRSSGLKADGGDFDAAAPGAGREADRLLEEKGVHKESPNGGLVSNGHAATGGSANGSASSPKEKTSLKTKIKAKLHRSSATAA